MFCQFQGEAISRGARFESRVIEIEYGAIRERNRKREYVCVSSNAHRYVYTSIYRYLLPEKLIPARLILGRRYPLDPPLTTATDRPIIFDRERGRKRARDRNCGWPSSLNKESRGNENGTG